jgi:hypothetical protein
MHWTRRAKAGKLGHLLLIHPMSIQVLIVGIHLARSTRGKPCAPPQWL